MAKASGDITGGRFCVSCGAPIDEDDLFCSKCGVTVGERCPSCGETVEAGDAFCQSCGTKLDDHTATLHAVETESAAEAASTPAVQEPVAATRAPAPVPAPVAAATAVVPETAATEEAAAVAMNIRLGPLLGSVAIVVGALLPWISGLGGDGNAFDVPVQFLLSGDLAEPDGFDVAWLLIVVAVGAVALCFVPSARAGRRACGSVAIVIAFLYAFQLNDAVSGTELSLFDLLGMGTFTTLGGGIVLAIDF